MPSTGSSSSAHVDRAAAPADIVVALVADGDAAALATAARRVRDELTALAASGTVRFLLARAAPKDGTDESAREMVDEIGAVEVAPVTPKGFAETPYHGQPQRAALLHEVLLAAQRFGAKACAVVDASRPSAPSEHVGRLIAPIIGEGFDYVLPYYARNVQEGAITRGIVYPLFRALFGARLRQPATLEFGCSGRLLSHYLDQDVWERDHASSGIDLWLAVAAVCGEFRVCEAALGRRAAVRRDGLADLTTTLAQVASALFVEIEQRADVWQRVRGSVEVPLVGTTAVPTPDATPPDLEALMKAFRLGYRELREIWTWILPPRTIVELRKLAETSSDRFDLDDRLWATIVYDFVFAYSLRVMPRDHLLGSLTPLYNGWLASFVRQMQHATVAEIDVRVEQLCLAFEAEKRYLISRWRWPERFR